MSIYKTGVSAFTQPLMQKSKLIRKDARCNIARDRLTFSSPSKVGRPRTTTKIKISYDDGAAASGKRKGPPQLESRTAQTADAASEVVEAAAAAAANRSLEETWRRRE